MKKDSVPYGSDVAAGTYECLDCGHRYSNQSKTSMPPCPQFRKTAHVLKSWKILSGQGDAPNDPYPLPTAKPSGIKHADVITPLNKK